MSPSVVDRREERGARADGDVDLAAAEPPPHRVALLLREPAVEHRDVVAEARAKARHELRRQRDLGHEHERPAPGGEAGGDGAQVDLGLAGAGDAVEEERVRVSWRRWPPGSRGLACSCASVSAAARRDRRDLRKTGSRALRVGSIRRAPDSASFLTAARAPFHRCSSRGTDVSGHAPGTREPRTARPRSFALEPCRVAAPAGQLHHRD